MLYPLSYEGGPRTMYGSGPAPGRDGWPWTPTRRPWPSRPNASGAFNRRSCPPGGGRGISSIIRVPVGSRLES
jgi:hypothetical protein